MESKEIIRQFLTDNKIKFVEESGSFYLKELAISIPANVLPKLSRSNWTKIAMEIGMNSVKDLMEKLDKLEGAKIYTFKKKAYNV